MAGWIAVFSAESPFLEQELVHPALMQDEFLGVLLFEPFGSGPRDPQTAKSFDRGGP